MTEISVRTVGELVTRKPVTIRDTAPLAEAAKLLDEQHVHGVPVVDTAGDLVGVLSQTDLVRARATEHLWASWPGLAVKHLMTSPALTCTTTTPVHEAIATMELNHVHRLIVVDESGTKPVGVFSSSDVIHALAGVGPNA
jgi:CBS domain-containing protein